MRFRGVTGLLALSLGAVTIGISSPAHALPAATPIVSVGADGDVLAIARDANHVYIGGRFSYVGVVSDSGVTVDQTGGTRVHLPRPRGGTIRAATRDQRGGWFVGGDFTSIGGVARNGLARINSSGVVTSWAPSVTGRVEALAFDGTNVYVGGSFTNVAGVARANLAAIADATGTASSFAPNVAGSVATLSLDGANLFVGGTFTSVGGQPRANIARVSTTTGAVGSFAVGTDGPVSEVLVVADRVYVAGTFSTFGGSPRSNIASATISTGTVDAFAPQVSGPVHALVRRNNGTALFIGGAFSTVDAQTRNNLASVDPTTGALLPWTATTNGAVRDLELSQAHSGLATNAWLHAAGEFTLANASTRLRAAAIDTTTGTTTPWDPGVDQNARVVVRSGSNFFLGGDFGWVNGAPRRGVAALHRSTLELDRAWDPVLNGDVRALATSPDGTKVYVGGDFTTADGLGRSRAAAFASTTGELLAWNPAPNQTVRAIAASATRVYLGGGFVLIGGQTRNRIGAVDATTGAVFNDFDPGASSNVNFLELSPDGTRVYAGGPYATISGVAREGCAELDATTGTATTFNPTQGGVIVSMDLASDGSTLWCSTSSNRTYRYDIGGGNAPIWTLQTGGDVQAAADSADQLYIGGHFSNTKGAGGAQRVHLASVNRSDARTSTWNPAAGGIYGVWALEVVDDKVLVGGDFDNTGGRRQPKFAVYTGTP
jgi:Domain of unknown function (DUF5122) beta-propeller